MSASVNHLLTEALKLTPDEQTELIERLSGALSGPPALLAEWEAEIARRVADMDAGRTMFLPADEALSKLSDHIQARRPLA